MLQRQTLIQILFLIIAALCLTPWVNAPMALIAGFLFVQFLGNPFKKQTGKVSGFLLKASVVGLGFGMNFYSAIKVGADGFWLTLGTISLVLILGALVGRALKMSTKSSHLLASGTAICGGSAIAAVGPAVRASAQEMSVALAVVFMLNAVALIIFPIIGHALDMDQYHFGMWCAIAIHDTSSVVGAASAYGEEALAVATTVKLARALWILPLTIFSAIIFKNGEGKPRLPLFILFFILAMMANTWLPLPEILTSAIVTASRSGLVLSLFLIGTALSVQTIREVGVKPLALGLILWVACSAVSLPAVLWGI